MYFVHRSVDVEPEEAAARAEEYLARQEDVEPEIRDQAKAIVKSQQNLWQQWIEYGAVPAITFAPRSTLINLTREVGGFRIHKALEIYIQAFIYGHLDSFINENEAFGYAHEYAHRCARVFHSGSVLYELGERAHRSIDTLAATENLSHREIGLLWEEFAQTNEQIVSVAQKFRPLEEIFANYIGMRFSPSEVRNVVKSSLEKTLKEENWYTAYKAFADWCDSLPIPWIAAFHTFEIVSRILEKINIDGAKFLEIWLKMMKFFGPISRIIARELDVNLANGIEKLPLIESLLEQTGLADRLDKKLERLVEQEGIPPEVFEFALDSAVKAYVGIVHPKLVRAGEALINAEEQMLDFPPVISLRGRPSQKLVIAVPTYIDDQQEQEWHEFVCVRIFLESLRQQISKGCGLMCSLAERGKRCCGGKEQLLRLYGRLPEADRKRFKSPNCDLLR